MRRHLRTAFGLPVAALVLAAGCTGPEQPSSSAEQWTRDGAPVSFEVINSYDGGPPCDWAGTRFLSVSFPIHLAPSGAPHAAQYVRDPDGVLPGAQTRPAFRPGATLPADAKPTGYERDGTALWLADSDRASTAYLVKGDVIEAWPRADPILGCD